MAWLHCRPRILTQAMSEMTLTLSDIPFPFHFDGEPANFRLNFALFAALRQSLRSHSHAVPVTIMTRADFIHHITLHMPEVSARIEEEDFGILHLEMGAMKLATRDAIARYEFHTVQRHFAYIGYLFEQADRELCDAILVSYLESLFLDNAAPEYRSARSMLPARLEQALKNTERRFALQQLRFIKYLPAAKAA